MAGISIAEVVEDGSAVMICVQTSCAAYEPSAASGVSTTTVRAPCDASACSPATHALKRDVTGLLCSGARCVEGGDDQTMCCDALPQTTGGLQRAAGVLMMVLVLLGLACAAAVAVAGYMYLRNLKDAFDQKVDALGKKIGAQGANITHPWGSGLPR